MGCHESGSADSLQVQFRGSKGERKLGVRRRERGGLIYDFRKEGRDA
jgi:hypothetical protein